MTDALITRGILLAQGQIGFTAPPNSFSLPQIGAGQTTEQGVVTVLNVGVNVLFGISATAAVAGVMWGALLLIKGGDGLEKGKKAIMWSLLGLLVMSMAYSVVTIVTRADPAKEDLGVGIPSQVEP